MASDAASPQSDPTATTTTTTITTILFDLDGTLLGIDTDEFIATYLKAVSKHVRLPPPIGGAQGECHTDDPAKMMQWIIEGVNATVTNTDRSKTNEQVFFEKFTELSGVPQQDASRLFGAFYREAFHALNGQLKTPPRDPNGIASKIIKEAKRQGYKVSVATSPVFPLVAVHARMRWVDLLHTDFDLVTCLENFHAVKPSLDFYREVCQMLDVEPQHCIMVGNNVQEDMVASELGMKTFLVTDFIMDNGTTPHYVVDQKGTLEDLYNSLVSQTGIFANGPRCLPHRPKQEEEEEEEEVEVEVEKQQQQQQQQ